MERKIGELFDFKGKTLKVVENGECEECYLFTKRCTRWLRIRGRCNIYRSDGKSVIFKRVDKSLELLTKAHEELIRCGIESEIVDEIQEYIKSTTNGKTI